MQNKRIFYPRSLACLLTLTPLIFFSPLITVAKAIDSSTNALIEEDNFQRISKQMRDKQLPVLIEFHAESCSYCSLLEEDFLAPMVRSPEYQDKILIRKVQIDIDLDVIDFQGNRVSASQFAARYKTFMTPTMIFLDADGNEVAEKIVGINTPSLFLAYLDAEIEKALTRVRAKSPSQKGK